MKLILCYSAHVRNFEIGSSKIESSETPTWVAIDVAKGWNVAVVEQGNGQRRRFRFAHTRADYDRLVEYLHGISIACRIALEPTADYHRTLAYRLVAGGFEVVLVSSIASARLRGAVFNSWDKNDPKDAGVILRLLKQGMTQRYFDPLLMRTHDLQELSKTYHHIGRTRTQLQHILITHYFTLYWPEIERFWIPQRNEWLIRFLQRFPTPQTATELSLEAFTEIVGPMIGRRVHKHAKIEEIYDLAHNSIALPIAENSPAVATFRLQLDRYLQLTEARNALEAQADALLSCRTDYQHLRSLPGVGPIIALVILAEAGDIRRFNHHRQFLKYCGLDLAKSQSGNSQSRERLSKHGNARLRCALWIAAISAIRMKENSFRDKYQRYTAHAPEDADVKRKARTAVTAKLARWVYAVVKKDCLYRSRYELTLPSGSIPPVGPSRPSGPRR